MESANGIINKSMRQNYGEYGVEKYYSLVGSSYRNPHFPAIKQCVFAWLDAWWNHDGKKLPGESDVRVLDMAAGSGEVTICVLEWWRLRKGESERPSTSSNTAAPSKAFIPLSRAAKASAAPPPSLGPQAPHPVISATDPYTVEAYTNRTGLLCLPLSFQDIAFGKLQDEDDPSPIEMVICSFALHLVESPSELFALLWELSTKARWLIVISPHKKPEIKTNWGWTLWDTGSWEESASCQAAGILKDRVHCRVFKSANI